VRVQPKLWTIGFLANNLWSVAGHANIDKPPVNQFRLQWFVNYNMKKGWYLTTSPIITANWRAPGGSVWTVPFGGGLGTIMKLGFQPVNITAQLNGSFAVGRADAACVFVSQANQGSGEGVAGAKAERDESGAAAKAVNPSVRPPTLARHLAYLKAGRSHSEQGFERPRTTSKQAWRPHLLVLTIRKSRDSC
jgi:hypothetical protein